MNYRYLQTLIFLLILPLYVHAQETINVNVRSGESIDINLDQSVIGENKSFIIHQKPENGSLSGFVPNLTYTPNPGFVGEDSFTYFIVDESSATWYMLRGLITANCGHGYWP